MVPLQVKASHPAQSQKEQPLLSHCEQRQPITGCAVHQRKAAQELKHRCVCQTAASYHKSLPAFTKLIDSIKFYGYPTHIKGDSESNTPYQHNYDGSAA